MMPDVVGAAESGNRILLICRAALLENFRRREFYVVLFMMALFVMGMLVVRIVGIQNPATATFLMNLGLTLAFGFAKLVTILSAARQLPDELEHRTIYPLLAKPLTRAELVLGKLYASIVTGTATLGVLFLLAWLPVPHLERFSPGLLVQMLLLQLAGIEVVAAIAIMLSLILPRAVNLVLMVLLVAQGGALQGFIKAHFQQGAGGRVAQWLTAYIPDFAYLDLLSDYTNGFDAISFTALLLRLGYAVLFTVVPVTVATYLLERRPL